MTVLVTTCLLSVACWLVTVMGTWRVVTMCALENGNGVRGRLGIWFATDRGTGSVGRDTVLGRVVTVASCLVGWFCSSKTGCAFLTLSGGKG